MKAQKVNSFIYGGERSIAIGPSVSELLDMDKVCTLPFEDYIRGRVEFDHDFDVDARRTIEVTGEILPTQEFYDFTHYFDKPSMTHTRIKFPVMIPARNNKRKRIQKKWLKKYGLKSSYIYKPVDVRGMTITDNLDGTYSYDVRGYLGDAK